MALTLAICSLAIEGPLAVFSEDKFWGSLSATMRTACLICFPGTLAFAMTTSEFALIQRTSVVTLSVAGIFKEVSTIFLSTLIFHDELTPINISGLCVALTGIAMYNYLKYRQSLSEDTAKSLDNNRFEALPSEEEEELAETRHHGAMQRMPLYNPASEGIEGPVVADETHYTLGHDSDDDDNDSDQTERPGRGSTDEEDERRGFHKEYAAVDAQPVEGLDKALREDSDLVKLDEEQHHLEASLRPDT